MYTEIRINTKRHMEHTTSDKRDLMRRRPVIRREAPIRPIVMWFRWFGVFCYNSEGWVSPLLLTIICLFAVGRKGGRLIQTPLSRHLNLGSDDGLLSLPLISSFHSWILPFLRRWYGYEMKRWWDRETGVESPSHHQLEDQIQQQQKISSDFW